MATHPLFWVNFLVSALSAGKAVITLVSGKCIFFKSERTVSAVRFFHQQSCL